jgi:hypothetical protein
MAKMGKLPLVSLVLIFAGITLVAADVSGFTGMAALWETFDGKAIINGVEFTDLTYETRYRESTTLPGNELDVEFAATLGEDRIEFVRVNLYVLGADLVAESDLPKVSDTVWREAPVCSLTVGESYKYKMWLGVSYGGDLKDVKILQFEFVATEPTEPEPQPPEPTPPPAGLADRMGPMSMLGVGLIVFAVFFMKV